MELEEEYITICTPTYNRAHTLKRLFASLNGQSSKNFVWLVIDDGSVDGTAALIEELGQIADFPIEYHWKPNGGRHTALNYSYNYIKSQFVINIDSDDELAVGAVESIMRTLNSKEFRNGNYWQVSGRCIDSETRATIGKDFPADINEYSGKRQLKLRLKCSGEKSNVRNVGLLRHYPFPVYSDTKFVTENMVWEKIDKQYDTYCTNSVFRVYHQGSPDSLGRGKLHSETRMRSRYYYALFCLNELFDEISYNPRVLISVCNIARSAIGSNTPFREVMSSINKWYKRALVAIVGYPVGNAYFRIVDLRRQRFRFWRK